MRALANKNVSSLIGMDAYDLILSRGVLNGLRNTPKAINTLLVRTLGGIISAPSTTEQTMYQQCSQTGHLDHDLYQNIPNWIEFDTTGVIERVYRHSQDDKRLRRL